MPIPLHKDPIGSGVHVLKLPQWMRPSNHTLGRYWHIPRSAAWDPTKERPTRNARRNVELSLLTWCGQLRYAAWTDFTDTEPDEYKCGTCLGRFLGASDGIEIIHAPRNHWKPPTYCPGKGVGKDNLCFVCGVKTRWYWDREARHKPDLDQLSEWDPCPRHGWRDMMARSSRGTEWNGSYDILWCSKHNCGYAIGDTENP